MGDKSEWWHIIRETIMAIKALMPEERNIIDTFKAM